jgi:hypothetical protein
MLFAHRPPSAWVFVALIGLLLHFGCDTTLEPFDDETGTFSIRGYLSISDDTHFFRIKDLSNPLVEDSARTLDVAVTMENLTAGTSTVLEDSVVVFEGVYTHNFRYDQAVHPEATYRITVEHADGRTAQSTATMPPITDVVPDSVGTTARLKSEQRGGQAPSENLTVRSDTVDVIPCNGTVVYSFRNVPERRLLRFLVEVDWRRGRQWVEVDNPTVGPDGTPINGFQPSAIIASVVPTRELAAVQHACELLKENTMRVAYTHFGPDWPADSIVTDPLGSNVESGLGIFGGLHRDTLYQRVTDPVQ